MDNFIRYQGRTEIILAVLSSELYFKWKSFISRKPEMHVASHVLILHWMLEIFETLEKRKGEFFNKVPWTMPTFLRKKKANAKNWTNLQSVGYVLWKPTAIIKEEKLKINIWCIKHLQLNRNYDLSTWKSRKSRLCSYFKIFY